MSNRKNFVEYVIYGTHYYNEPHVRQGFIEYDKYIIVKPFLEEISKTHYWGKEVKYCGLYDSKYIFNENIMNIIFEMFSDDFINIDKIEINKGTKILNS